MRRTTLHTLRQIYAFRCGYCGVSETDAGATLTVDHFQPRAAQGADSLENLVYCCHACPAFKGDYWNPEAVERVLHPLNDGLETHLQEAVDGQVVGLTPTGVFHVEKLWLNRPALVAYRAEKRRLTRVTGAIEEIFELLERIERRVLTIENQLTEWRVPE